MKRSPILNKLSICFKYLSAIFFFFFSNYLFWKVQQNKIFYKILNQGMLIFIYLHVLLGLHLSYEEEHF